MPMGHLMLGLLGGIAALVGALVAGMSVWMALLAYVAVGNLMVLGGAALQVLVNHARRPPSRPARASQRRAKLRVVHASH